MKLTKLLPTMLMSGWLSACSYAPDERVTDKYATDWMKQTKDKASLEGKHHIMVVDDDGGLDGKELGVLHASDVNVDENTGLTCMEYEAFTFYDEKEGDKTIETESESRTVCVSSSFEPE